MPRLFYPPLVEPGVYIKPNGIQEKQGLEEIPDPVGASDTSFLDNNSCMRMGGAGDCLGQHLTKRVIGIAPAAGNGIRDAQNIAMATRSFGL